MLLLRVCRSGRHQVPLKKIGFRGVGRKPRALQEEAVNFIGEDQLFELDALFSQGAG